LNDFFNFFFVSLNVIVDSLSLGLVVLSDEEAIDSGD